MQILGGEFLIADWQQRYLGFVWIQVFYGHQVSCLLLIFSPSSNKSFQNCERMAGEGSEVYFSSGESIPPFSEHRDPSLSWG